MKHILLAIVFLITMSLTSDAQKYNKYKIFSTKDSYGNSSYGLRDSTGKEILKPIFSMGGKNKDYEPLFFKDYNNRKIILFFTKTGEKKVYDQLSINSIQIDASSFCLVRDQKKTFLINLSTYNTIPLSKDYYQFDHVGKFFVAKFQEKPKIKSQNTAQKRLEVFSYGLAFTPLLTEKFEGYIPLYKYEEESLSGNDDISMSSDEDKLIALLFNKKNEYYLYDNSLKLMEVFKNDTKDKTKLIDSCSKILKVRLIDNLEEIFKRIPR